jgi:signal transduction histidine kinase/CheY-like chemotaxis protein
VKLARLFAWTTLLLVAMVGLMLSNIVLAEWRGYRTSQAGLDAMQTAWQAMVVAEKASAERGPTNGVLGDGEPPDPAKQERLRTARATTDRVLHELLQSLQARPALAGGEAERAVQKAQEQLAAARGAADAMAALRREQREPARLMAVVHGMFDVIPVVMEAVTLLARDAESIYPQFSDAIVGARLAAELREYAGRLGSQFTAALNAGQPLGASEQVAIQTLRGRIAQLQELIELPTRTWQADPRMSAAVDEMRQQYFGHGLAFIADVERASQERRPYGLDTAAFAARYVPDMGSIVRLRDVMISIAIEGGEARKAQARRTLAWISSLGAATLLVLALVFLTIRQRVLRPLLGVTRSLGELAGGRLDSAAPVSNRPDEIGDMQRAVAALQASSIDKERLEAQLRSSRDQVTAQAGQLERQNEALKENARLREDVERISRHDIKTPLNSIVAIPRLLRERRGLPAEDRELLNVVERAGYRILSMVNLSLDLFRMEQGKYVFRPERVDAEVLVRNVFTDLRAQSDSHGVALQLAPVAAPVHAWAEELLSYSMLANLLKNAVEASPRGAEVTVRLEPADDEGKVALHIHNRGVVPDAVRASFFRKYATAGKPSGTGLGAYSAWRMARAQEGDISMRTSEEDGTLVTVRLLAPPPQPSGMPGVAAPALRVLLVDDDEWNLLIGRRFLPAGLQVDTAADGESALALCAAQPYELVVMDLDMPVMGGIEAARRLRAQEAAGGARAYLVALSSHDDAQTRQRCMDAGFDQYATKPVTPEKLADVAVRAAERRGAFLPSSPSPLEQP